MEQPEHREQSAAGAGPQRPQQPSPGAQSPEDLSRAIEAQVRDAVGALTQVVQATVTTVTDSVRQGVQTAQPYMQQTMEEMRRASAEAKKQAKKAQEKEKRRPERFSKKANEAAGSAGGQALVAGIMTAVTISSVLNGAEWGSLILAVIAVWFACGAVTAGCKAKRLRRLAVYMNLLADRTNVTVEQLAGATGKSESFVCRDLKRMLACGLLDAAYLSPDGTRLFTGELSYRLYCSQRQEREKQEQEAAKARQTAPQRPAAQPKTQPAASSVLETCRGFAAQLANKSECIDDPVVTAQVDELAEHTRRIIAWLEKHPQQEGRIKRFVSYYLPTTLKLLDTYDELEPHAVSASVAAQSMEEIAQILTTINKAYQTLEDGLVQDTAMDVSAEISALETVMAQEGLTAGGPGRLS